MTRSSTVQRLHNHSATAFFILHRRKGVKPMFQKKFEY